jgi:hypothetical protein
MQEELRVKQAAERERREREAAQRVLEEQQRTKLANVERQQPAGLALAGRSTETRTESPPQAGPASMEQSCERDGAKLARLRGSPSREEVVQFERSLTCEKLRPQVMRLRESLTPDAAPVVVGRATVEPAKPAAAEPILSVPQPAPAAKQEVGAKPPERLTDTKDQPRPPVSAAEQQRSCKQDEARLAKIRIKPAVSDLVALERGLVCERLRPQIVRLRESLT